MKETWVTNLLIFVAVVVVAVLLTVLLVLHNNKFSATCTAAGGHPIVTRDMHLCLKPDSLIKVNQ